MSDKSCTVCGKESVYFTRYPGTLDSKALVVFYCEVHKFSMLPHGPAFIFINPDTNPQHIWCEDGLHIEYYVKEAIAHAKWFLDRSDLAYALYFRKGNQDLNPINVSLKDDWSAFEAYARNIIVFNKDRSGKPYPSKIIQFSLEMCFEPSDFEECDDQ